jgi:hypothetical protein
VIALTSLLFLAAGPMIVAPIASAAFAYAYATGGI